MKETPEQFFTECQRIARNAPLTEREKATALLRASARDYRDNLDTKKEKFFGTVLEIAAMNYAKATFSEGV